MGPAFCQAEHAGAWERPLPDHLCPDPHIRHMSLLSELQGITSSLLSFPIALDYFYVAI